MVSKKILGVAIAAAMLSQGAFAFTTATATQNISAQTLLEAGKVVKTGAPTGTYYSVTAGANIDTTFTGTLGVGLATNQAVYIRVDLTNAVFKAARTTAHITLADSAAGVVTKTISQGGDLGAIASTTDSYVIYSILPSASAKFDIGSAFSMTLGDLLAKGTGTVGVKVTAYDQLSSAIASTPVLSTSNAPTALTFVTNGLTPAATAVNPVASVEKLFKEFVVAAPVAAVLSTVGSYTATVTAGVASATTGATVAAETEVANTATSTVKYVGDFSVAGAVWGVSATNACGALTNVTLNTAKTEATIDLATAITKPFLCVDLPDTAGVGTTAVPASTYTASVTYTAIAGAATAIGAQATSASSNLGSITRDGTTVLVPFINVNPSFNQKIIIVNRSTAAAALTFTNPIGDDAATGFALTTAGSTTMSLPASKQTVLNSVDLLTVDTASTSKKGAVTLNIAAPSSKVDVLFQTTNADGAQNTIILQNDGKKFGGN